MGVLNGFLKVISLQFLIYSFLRVFQHYLTYTFNCAILDLAKDERGDPLVIYWIGGSMLEKIKEGLLPIIASFECHLDSMEYVKEKGEWYLRVFIEKNDGNLDMDTCVAVSEAVSEKLDEL